MRNNPSCRPHDIVDELLRARRAEGHDRGQADGVERNFTS
jgi:hypothetical protein